MVKLTSWLAIQYAVDNGVDITTSSHSYKWYFNPQPNYPMHRQMTDVELAAGVLHTNSTSNDGNSVGIPFNISAPGNCPGPWMHPDQTLVGGVSSVIGVGNVDAFYRYYCKQFTLGSLGMGRLAGKSSRLSISGTTCISGLPIMKQYPDQWDY